MSIEFEKGYKYSTTYHERRDVCCIWLKQEGNLHLFYLYKEDFDKIKDIMGWD